jgi:alpha-beta hydrolase superfamily lysophospholipase
VLPLTQQPIRGSRDPVEHGLTVWDTYIRRCKAQDIVIIAHSFGGVVTTTIALERVRSLTFSHAFFPQI